MLIYGYHQTPSNSEDYYQNIHGWADACSWIYQGK